MDSPSTPFEQQPCVGLFGTCGQTTFRRDLFIPAYESRSLPYFNPQVDNWQPELAHIEADHLAFDVVQCWPVLGSPYGTGSLAELGFSIATTLRTPSPLPKFVVVLVELELDAALDNPIARKESLRARQLTVAHLANSPPHLYVVSSLPGMLQTSVALFAAAQDIVSVIRRFNPAYARYVEQQRRPGEASAVQTV